MHDSWSFLQYLYHHTQSLYNHAANSCQVSHAEHETGKADVGCFAFSSLSPPFPSPKCPASQKPAKQHPAVAIPPTGCNWSQIRLTSCLQCGELGCVGEALAAEDLPSERPCAPGTLQEVASASHRLYLKWHGFTILGWSIMGLAAFPFGVLGDGAVLGSLGQWYCPDSPFTPVSFHSPAEHKTNRSKLQSKLLSSPVPYTFILSVFISMRNELNRSKWTPRTEYV